MTRPEDREPTLAELMRAVADDHAAACAADGEDPAVWGVLAQRLAAAARAVVDSRSRLHG